MTWNWDVFWVLVVGGFWVYVWAKDISHLSKDDGRANTIACWLLTVLLTWRVSVLVGP